MPNETALRARTNAAPIISRYWAAPEIWSRANAVPADARHLPLTDRQLECLRWISLGKSSPDIGVILSISGRTVDYHVNAICERLGVRTRMQAVAHAIRRGWLIADHIS